MHSLFVTELFTFIIRPICSYCTCSMCHMNMVIASTYMAWDLLNSVNVFCCLFKQCLLIFVSPVFPRLQSITLIIKSIFNTVESLRRDTCCERLPVFKDHTSDSLRGSTFQCTWTCHQRPPLLKDHIFMVNSVVFHDRFHSTSTEVCVNGN